MANIGSKEVISTLKKIHEELSRHKVAALFLFGSVVRNEARPDSDIDILVEFTEPVGLFELIRLKYYLEGILNRTVDLVPKDGLREEFKESILKEAIRAA